MPRDTSAKGRASRLDPTGYKRPSALVRARPVAALIVCLAAAGWVALAGRPGGADQSIYMPGPVAAAHASFANDCAKCHDGGATAGSDIKSLAGAFGRGVSDKACLVCHEAPVHHPNQVGLRSGMSSANCASCHVEHRARPALAAAADATCVSCHADLTGRSLQPSPATAKRVTAFSATAHPQFGRPLRNSAGAWVDPTRLRFNHKAHFDQESKPELKDCSTCHATADGPSHAATGDSLARSYMRPVSYERNCKSCHAITLPGVGTVALAHDRLDVVRAQLNAMPALIDNVVNAPSAPAATTSDEAVARVQQELDHVTEAVRSASRENKESFERITQFVRSRAAGDPAAVKATTTEAVLRGARVTQPHARRVEWAVVFSSEGRCTKCHDVRGEVVPGYAEPSRPPTADSLVPSWETVQAPPGSALETVATGISSSPRRWFANARFDHRSHRSATCLDCHAGVQQSTNTADLSLPDLASKPAGRPSARSCVDCHHAGTGGAAATCVTCHDYHNSRLEHAPVGQRGLWDVLQLTPSSPGRSAEQVSAPAQVVQPAPTTEPTVAPTAPAAVPAAPAPSDTDLPPPPDVPAAKPADAAPATDLPPPPDVPALPDAAAAPDLPPPPP